MALEDWTNLVLQEDESLPGIEDDRLVDILSQASKLGYSHPVWMDFRRKNKTGEFSEDFEQSGCWDGTEENREHNFREWLASDAYQKSFREKCLGSLIDESLTEGVSADDSRYGVVWTLLVDALERKGVGGDLGAIADHLVASLRDAGSSPILSNDEIHDFYDLIASSDIPKVREAIDATCDALQEVKVKRAPENAIVIAWSYESDMFTVRVPGEKLKFFKNKTAARKYAIGAKKRTDDQPRGYRVYDFTRKASERMWYGGTKWGPVKRARKASKVEGRRRGRNLFPYGIHGKPSLME